MSKKHTFTKSGIALAAAVAAFAGLGVTGPSASAATALADCTASLDARYSRWTAQCTAPHVVTVRLERWWYALTDPGTIRKTTGDFSRLVEPGTPWSERVLDLPYRVTVQVCLTAYQDSTVQITPRTCYAEWTSRS